MTQQPPPKFRKIGQAAARDREILKAGETDQLEGARAYEAERTRLDLEATQAEVDRLKAGADEANQLNLARKEYASSIRWFMWAFGIMYFAVLLLDGFAV